MSLKSFVTGAVTKRMTSEKRLMKRRAAAEKKRKAAGAPHIASYFHQVDDPYSHLVVQVLAEFANRYDVVVEPHIVPPPPDNAAPDRARLITHSRIDAERLASKAGLSYKDPGTAPTDTQIEAASRRFVAAIHKGSFLEDAPGISASVWAPGEAVSNPVMASAEETADMLKQGAMRREELQHYLGATLHYGGEWYWGIDRLAFLEERLVELGTAKNSTVLPPIYAQPVENLEGCGQVPPGTGIDAFLSYRSPYSAIAAERIFDLARAYGAELNLKFVLPMVMRGMEISPHKKKYIPLDAAREARRLGIPFGRIFDPVGKPVERAYSILPYAMDQGKGEAFTRSFMQLVWASAVDPGSDSGLKQIVENAGLNWADAKRHIGTERWRSIAEQNRQELLDMGQWGVPSFRLGDVNTWGNDRLWVIEDALKQLAS